MHNKIKHSKVRNTGLLYEILLRQITADVLNKNERSKAVSIVKEKFNERTELGKERTLYHILVNKKFESDKKADYFINEVLNQRAQLNNSALRREKYNLIKELKDNYDLQKILSSKVSNYKVYASIYKLFEYGDKLTASDKTESHFNLVEHVTTKKENINLSHTVNLPNDEDLRILTYKTLLEKFNSKYSKLNLAQKNLLREYINNISNSSSLKEYIIKQAPKIKSGLRKYSKNLTDKVVQIKLKEAIKSLDKLCGVTDKSKVIKDSHVLQSMRYLELLRELKKSENKNKKVI